VWFICACLTRTVTRAATPDQTPGWDKPEWPERFPVVGPAAGVVVALSETVVAAVEGDGVAATVFGVLVVLLGAVAWRNSRADEPGPAARGEPAGRLRIRRRR
jgi:hypothetical protein